MFDEIATTTWGENVFIVGSITELGNWAPANATALSATQYASSNNLWTVTISLPAGMTFEYKYIRIETDGSVFWESGPNRSYTVASGCAATVTESDIWR
jgi:glucoamylase